MTTTREAALEAALRNIAGGNLGDMPWQANYDRIRAVANAAISTPATEPHGYVEGLEAVLEIVADGHSKDFTDNCILARNALAARPAPQPAADTRVVPLIVLENLIFALETTEACLKTWNGSGGIADTFGILEQIRAIIGTATPAPSDKIAEAARVLNAACDAMWNDHARLEKTPDRFGQEWQLKHCHIKAISEAQRGLHAALAGQEK